MGPSLGRRGLLLLLSSPVSSFFTPRTFSPSSPRWLQQQQQQQQQQLRAESDELSWQEGLERVLNPFTPLGEKQIMLQNLVARRDEVIADVSSAASSGSPQDLLPKNSELRKAADGAAAVQRQIVEDILPSLLEEVPTLGSDLVSATPELIARAAEAVSWVVASRS